MWVLCLGMNWTIVLQKTWHSLIKLPKVVWNNKSKYNKPTIFIITILKLHITLFFISIFTPHYIRQRYSARTRYMSRNFTNTSLLTHVSKIGRVVLLFFSLSFFFQHISVIILQESIKFVYRSRNNIYCFKKLLDPSISAVLRYWAGKKFKSYRFLCGWFSGEWPAIRAWNPISFEVQFQNFNQKQQIHFLPWNGKSKQITL